MDTNSLPFELVSQILEELYYDLRRQPDHTTLSICAQVCRVWRTPAQKLLFRELTLPGRHRKPQLESFRAAVYVPSERSSLLASYVRRVHISIGGAVVDQDSDVSDFIELLSHCRQVYEVTLRVQGVHDFGPETLDALRTAHQQALPVSIRAFGLLTCGTLSPILYQLLSVWPTVQYLRLGTELAALPPDLPVNARLYELILWRVPRPTILQWLLSASKDTLRILDCHTAPDRQYDHVLNDFYAQLQSLRILRHTLPSNSMIRKCVGLRELILVQYSNFIPLGQLPQTLEHFGFRHFPGATNFSLKPIISAIHNLPKLRLVSCDASAQEHEEYASLRSICEKRNIVICNDVLPLMWTVSIAGAVRL